MTRYIRDTYESQKASVSGAGSKDAQCGDNEDEGAAGYEYIGRCLHRGRGRIGVVLNHLKYRVGTDSNPYSQSHASNANQLQKYKKASINE